MAASVACHIPESFNAKMKGGVEDSDVTKWVEERRDHKHRHGYNERSCGMTE
jgi:hypothetical protein